MWYLLRDDVPVAVIDALGRVVTRHGLHELLPVYRSNGGSLTKTITHVFGDELP